MTPPERQARLQQFEQAHRARRLPVTMQRRAVFAAILERDDHPTADEVYAAVHRTCPEMARMTVKYYE